MLRAFSLALGQLFDRRILGVLGLSVLLSLLSFGVLCWTMFWGIDWLLAHVLPADGSVHTALDWLGTVVAAVLLAWLLFPLVVSAFVGLFLDRVARIVEERHYPWLPRAPGLPWHQAVVASLLFLALIVVANLLLLFLLLFPIAYPIGFFAVNGLLVGREYFELVALRRLDRTASRALRRPHEGELLLTGVALTFLLTVPFVNLITPVFATAAMVHRVEQWRQRLPQAGGG